MATPLTFHAAACGRLVSRPTTASGGRAAAMATPCSQLHANVAVKRGRHWPRPASSMRCGRRPDHPGLEVWKTASRVMLVSADDVSSVACGMWPSRRATGEELTSTACATQHSIRAGRMVRRRRSSAGLGRLSRLRHRRSPFPAPRIFAHGRNQDRLRYDEVTDLTRSPDPPRLPLSVPRA